MALIVAATCGTSACAANQRPVARAGGDIVVNDNGTGRECVQLYGSYSYDPDGRITAYRWTKDGKEIGQSAKDLNQFFSLGTHVLTLTVTDDEGASASDTVAIAVRRGHDTSPYPNSEFITGVTFDWPMKRKEARGSDIWPITWADDAHQYTSWGDGGGFGGSNSDGRVSIGFGRVEGGWDDYTGYNVWGGKDCEHPATFTGKACGIVSVGGVLYAVRWACRDELDKSRMLRSEDRGASWTAASWAWDQHDDEVHAGTICNAGQDHRDAPDGYVYFYFTRIRLPAQIHHWDWIQLPENDVVLARAPRDRLMGQDAYRWFAGLDADGRPIWAPDVRAKEPVFHDPLGTQVVAVSYNPVLRRYLLTNSHKHRKGNMSVFEAPHPWGPWKTVAYLNGVPELQPDQRGHIQYHFAPKWWSTDGRSFTLVYTEWDSWNTVRGRLAVSDAGVR
jgi:hypothetical protein